MKYLYKYPQRAFPYNQLVEENRRRGRADAGIRTARHRHLRRRPLLRRLRRIRQGRHRRCADAHHRDQPWPRARTAACAAARCGSATTGRGSTTSPAGHHARRCAAAAAAGHAPQLEPILAVLRSRRGCCCSPTTRATPQRLWGLGGDGFAKDGFDEFVVNGRPDAVNRAMTGSKAAPHYQRLVATGRSLGAETAAGRRGELQMRWARASTRSFEKRMNEADDFYRRVTPFDMPDDLRNVQRQAFAGMMWSKQFYHYTVDHWLQGDFIGPPPPPQRAARPQPPSGAIWPRPTCCRCRTNGNTRGSPPGTWPFTAWPSR